MTSALGFEVEEHFPYSLEYREAGRVLRISAEMSTAPGSSILLFHDVTPAPTWQPPFRDVPIDGVTMRTILVRVTAAMLLLNIRPDWQTLPPDAERSDWAEIFAEARRLLPMTMSVARELLTRTYAAFNARDVDTVLAQMHPDVDWPNGMEGGRVRGHAAVRDYWTRQWGVIDPHVEPRGFAGDGDGRIAVDVHQVVRDLTGKILSDQRVQHVYAIRDGLITRMDIRT